MISMGTITAVTLLIALVTATLARAKTHAAEGPYDF
jgi:hypothetical protein